MKDKKQTKGKLVLRPFLTLKSVKVSTQWNPGKFGQVLEDVYWFEWKHRTVLEEFVLNIEFLDASGNVITHYKDKMKRVTITGGTTENPIYSSPMYISIRDTERPERAVGFRYWTIKSLFKPSYKSLEPITEVYDDLRKFM